MSRTQKRSVMSLVFIGLGIWLFSLGGVKRGLVFTVTGVLGLCGVNVFCGGSLDKRLDLKSALNVQHESNVVEGTILKVRRWPYGQICYFYRDHTGRRYEGESDLFPPDEVAAWKVGDVGAVLFDQRRPKLSMWIGKRSEGASS
jgi:hypothetical protein